MNAKQRASSPDGAQRNLVMIGATNPHIPLCFMRATWLAFEGDSKVVWFEGNYADYEADRHRRLGDEADNPHRIRYKPLAG